MDRLGELEKRIATLEEGQQVIMAVLDGHLDQLKQMSTILDKLTSHSEKGELRCLKN